MMKSTIILIFGLLFNAVLGFSQLPDLNISKEEVEKHIRFLSSDEMGGRMTGEIGNDIAARYIAEEFRSLGMTIPDGQEDYLQAVNFRKRKPAQTGSVLIGDSTLVHGDQIMMLSGDADTATLEMVWVEYGWQEDGYGQLDSADVEGKLVVTLHGSPHSSDVRQAFSTTNVKRDWIKERGGLGLLEIYGGGFPWNGLRGFLLSERVELTPDDDEKRGLYMLCNDKLTHVIDDLKEKKVVNIDMKFSGQSIKPLISSNVMGIIEGSDPKLKDEYLVLSAHYDHVGAKTNPNDPSTQVDSIYNGARDNALGTSAILVAAKSLSMNPPKRSVLIIAYTGEEIGLLGSKYYVEHPVIPLKDCIFNLNTDGAGYNDSTSVVVMGYDRVGVKKELDKAAAQFGLKVLADPAPEQGLFDRSDNVNFARMGVPAPTFSPGFTAFDEQIMKNYHQPSDEASTLDFEYVTKYCRTFVQTARMIADKKEKPRWKEGDKYEEAFNNLYKNSPE